MLHYRRPWLLTLLLALAAPLSEASACSTHI